MKKIIMMMTLVAVFVLTMSTNALALDIPNPVEFIKDKVEETFPERLHEEFETNDSEWSVEVTETNKGEFEVTMTSKTNWEVINNGGEKLSDAKRIKLSWTQKEYNNRIRKEFEAFTFSVR